MFINHISYKIHAVVFTQCCYSDKTKGKGNYFSFKNTDSIFVNRIQSTTCTYILVRVDTQILDNTIKVKLYIPNCFLHIISV